MVIEMILDPTDTEEDIPYGVAFWQADGPIPGDLRLIGANHLADSTAGTKFGTRIGQTLRESFPDFEETAHAQDMLAAATEGKYSRCNITYRDVRFTNYYIPLGNQTMACAYKRIEATSSQSYKKTHWALILTTFLIGLVVYGGVLWWTEKRHIARKENVFAEDAKTTVKNIEQWQQTYENLLVSVSGLFTANQKVTRSEFSRFVSSSLSPERYPSVQALGFARIISDREKTQLEKKIREEGHPSFAVHPEMTEETLYVVDFIEPLKRNTETFGLDLGSDPALRATVEQARDTGQITATGAITLTQKAKQQQSFLFLHPIYNTLLPPGTIGERRDAFVGVAIAVFHTENLFRTILKGIPTVQVEVYDSRQGEGSTFRDNQLLFKSDNALPESESDKHYSHTSAIEIGNRVWWVQSSRAHAGFAVDILIVACLIFLITTTGTVTIWSIARNKDHKNQKKAAAHERKTEETNIELTVKNAYMAAKERQLQSSNEELKQFAYIASHDLQEPLRMVTGFTDRLSKRLEGTLDEISLEYMSLVSDGAKRMRELILDLLQFSRVESPEDPHRSLVNLHSTFGAILTDLSTLIEETGAVIEVTRSLPTVWGWPSQLHSLFLNLLSNALKFRPPGMTPHIWIEATEETADVWTIKVRDDGIGIDPAQFERIFQPFRRLHTREEYAGTGIGLALCRKIAQRHNGKIYVTSTPGEGATFVVTLAGSLQQEQHESEGVFA